MSETEIVKLLLQASWQVVLAIGAVALVWKATGIVAGVKSWQEARNEGERIRATREAAANDASNRSVEIAVRAMEEQARIVSQTAKELLQEMRAHFDKRQDEMLAGMRLLEGENQELRGAMDELRDELEEKDKLIATLRAELDTLKARMNGAARKPTRKKAA